jgi:hypothetical protein
MAEQQQRVWPVFPSIVERDYEAWYYLHEEKYPFYAHRHLNGLYVIGFANEHPIHNGDDQVVEVDFSAGDKDLSGNAGVAKGKRKRDAEKVKSQSVLCVVKCASGAEYSVPACVPDTSVITVNKIVEKTPSIIQQDVSFPMVFRRVFEAFE